MKNFKSLVIFLLVNSLLFISVLIYFEIKGDSGNKNLFGDYGSYHVIEFRLYPQREKYKNFDLCQILTIDGEKTEKETLFNIEYFGGGVPDAIKPIKVSGFVTLEPVGSPVKNFPEKSIEKTKLNHIYNNVPPFQPKDGRYYVVDMEPLIYHLKEIFIVTSVISPDEARIKFERSLEE